jgi:hypothetical protein
VINDTLDLANELAYGLKREAAGEALATEPRISEGIVPQQSVFVVESISGKKFRVTVTKERS